MKKYTTCELRNPNNNFIVRVVNNKELNKLSYYCPTLAEFCLITIIILTLK